MSVRIRGALTHGAVGSLKSVLLTGSAFFIATHAAAALAQDAPSSQDTGTQTTAPSAEGLGDIIVTATRRSERLQEVPASMVAVNAEQLQRNGATRLEDVLVSVPNVSYSASTSTRMSFLAIRGVIGPEDDPAVGLYIDNVYVGKRAIQGVDFLDPESVEVLRGPQGALYGKNTLGGVIVVTNRKPSLDKSEGFVEMTAGDYGLVRGKAAFSIPLGDGFAVRFAGRANTRSGYYRNIYNDSRIGGMSSQGAVASVRYANADVDFTLTGDYDHNSNDSQILRISRFTDIGAAVGDPALPFAPGTFVNPTALAPDPSRPVAAQLPVIVSGDLGNREVAVTAPGYEIRRIYGVSGNLSVDLGGATLRSTTAYRGFKLGLSLPVASGTLGYSQYLQQDQYSQELTLLSSTSGPFSWIIGSSYYYDRFEYDQTPVDLEGRIIGTIAAFGAIPFADVARSEVRTRSAAAYGQVKYAVSDRLSLTAGLRYSHDSRSIRKSETSYVGYGLPFQIALPAPYTLSNEHDHITSSAWLPEAILQYKASAGINLYLKASRSYRPAGFVPEPTVPQPDVLSFKKESAWSYEGGVKTSFAGGRVVIDLAAFYLDWHNQQITVTNQPIGYITANEDSHSIGLELDTQFRPTSNLQFGVAAAWLPEAKIDGTEPISSVDIYTASYTMINPKGLRLARAPRYSGSAFVEYTLPTGEDERIRLRGDASYKSKEHVLQGDSITSPNYTQVDLRAAYEFHQLSFGAWVKNLTNDYYLAYTQVQAGADFTSISDPRTYGMTISYRF